MAEAGPLLQVRGLCVSYGAVRAVDGVDLEVFPGEILGLVGESGSGKSTLVGAVLRTLAPPGAITAGQVWFDGQDVLAMEPEPLRAFRWSEVSLVPQSAQSALNPILTVQAQLVGTLCAHGVSARAARARAPELLAQVGLDPSHCRSYPHQLSGGMRQRVVLALALALRPRLVVLDEPTTALDVVVEREILRHLLALQRSLGFAVVFVTHDLPLLQMLASRIGVLYAGQLVEIGPAGVLGSGGLHPYTRGLVGSILPRPGQAGVPRSIPGGPPGPDVVGCPFHPRCPLAEERCHQDRPPLRTRHLGQAVACHVVR